MATSALLVGCGSGGGNDGGDNGGTAAPSPLPDPQVAFDTSNAETIGTLIVASGEAMLMLADEAAVALQRFDDTMLYQATDNCSNGSARYLLTDNDQDGGLSVGDLIRTDYTTCNTASTGGTLRGDLFVTLEEIAANRGTDEFRYVASVDAGAVSLFTGSELLTFDKPMTVVLERGIYESQLTVAGDVDVTFSIPSSGASIGADWQSMIVTKRESYETADYEVSMAGTWQSNILSGPADITTVEPLTGPLNTWPTSGRIDVAGADGSGIRVGADGPGPGDFAVFAVDADGDGVFTELDQTRAWENMTTGYLWWFELSSPFDFAIRSYDPDDFRILTWRPHDRGEFGFEPTAANPTIRVLTSREIDPASVPAELRIVSIQDDWPFIDIRVDVDVEVRGAMILIRPLQQLAFGTPYRFPEQPFMISDLNGNTLLVSDLDTRLQVVDDLVAETTPEESYGFPGDQIALGAGGSVANAGSISGFDWSQDLGTAASIVGADQPSATVTLPATAETELLRVNLQIANEFGEIDFAKTDITVFPSLDDIDFVFVRALTTAGEWQEWLLTPANGEQQYLRSSSNQLDIDHETDYVNTELSAAFRQNWRIGFASLAGTQLAPGLYDNISGATGTETEPGFSITGDAVCQLGSAQFEVLAFATDAAGQPDSLAIDFSAQCDLPNEFERVEGFVRLRSDLPVN